MLGADAREKSPLKPIKETIIAGCIVRDFDVAEVGKKKKNTVVFEFGLLDATTWIVWCKRLSNETRDQMAKSGKKSVHTMAQSFFRFNEIERSQRRRSDKS